MSDYPLTPRDANGVPRVSLEGTTSVVAITPAPDGYYIDLAKNGSNENLSVDGSGTPIEFDILPHNSKNWYINRLIYWMRCSAGGLGKFGGGDELTNGLLTKVIANGLGPYDWFNAKTNIEILSRATNGEIISNAFSGGDELIVGRFELEHPIGIRTGTSDKITIVVRDDLTELTLINVIAEGWLT